MPAFLALWKEGTPHDALLWCIASIQQKLYLHKGTFIEYRRHDRQDDDLYDELYFDDSPY